MIKDKYGKPMKFLMVYPGYIVREQPVSVMALAAVMKKMGVEVRLIHLTPYRKRPKFGDLDRVILSEFQKELSEFKPDIVGFSMMTINLLITRRMCKAVKEFEKNTITILGGIHPTIEPEKSILEENVDIISIGEADESLPELLLKISSGDDYSNTKGFWFKKDGNVIRNENAPLVKDLDALPLADRDMLGEEYMDAELYGANIFATRGCPYPCSFCQNKFLMDLYQGQGSFVRHRSYENIFSEIDYLIEKYNIKRLSFSDETFTINKKYIIGFCEEYKKKYKLPFLCQTRPNTVDDEVFAALKDAGCDFVNMAIESGDEYLRNTILNRKLSREVLVNAFALARKHGIRTGAYNIIGIPGETIDTIWETIKINKEINAERLFCTIYMPFKGTELGEKILSHPEMILAQVEDAEIYYTTVTVKPLNLSPRTIFGYQGFLDYYVRLDKKYHFIVHFFRYLYQILPPVHKVKGLMRAIREFFIQLVYNRKNLLPTPGGFLMKKM
jgi:radical SAM superfamily enzyme YgiQ (UPF0313 family)